MKKTLCFVLILSMAVSVLFVSNVSADGNTKTVGYLTFTEHGTYCEVTKCDKSATGDMEIPSSVVFDGKYLPVTEIAGNLTEDYPRYGAFGGCTEIESVTIPDGVRYIGELAFYGCRMEYTVYEGLDYLGSKSNPYYALISSPASPENVTVHEDTKVIADDALIECASAKSLTVSKNNTVYHSKDNCIIKTDDKTLVRGCKNSIIPADGSVAEIGYGAFRYCNGLTDLIIPDSVTSIGLYAFCSCEDLKTVSIGSGLKLIGVQAFSGLNSLEKINYAGSEEEWNDIIILRFNEELINARKEFGAALPEVIPSVPVGDCNFDGSIDNKDVFVLFRYITNEEHADDETVYDFVADGSVDNKDVVALFRYISAT